MKLMQRSPSQVKGEGLKILSRRGSPVQIRPAAPYLKMRIERVNYIVPETLTNMDVIRLGSHDG